MYFLIIRISCLCLHFQGSTKCRARVITRLFSDGEKVIHRSFVHNHNPKAGAVEKILGMH